VWRDELYLDLHRGCATSRPDQKRHNRSLERLLREADLTAALLRLHQGVSSEPVADWRLLLFQQFHDILPGTSIPEVFEQAEPQWRPWWCCPFRGSGLFGTTARPCKNPGNGRVNGCPQG
jgi:alpha-mannosidase